MNYFYPLVFISIFLACNLQNTVDNKNSVTRFEPGANSVNEIPLPAGFRRINADEHTFTHWLRSVKLKKDSLVHLYDGRLKTNQSAQFAVLDIPVSNKDLQQCADAVIRLRAEYLFAEKKFDEIKFADNNGKEYKWTLQDDRQAFEKYLETVFGWCGSASLEKQLKPVLNISEIQPGNVFIKGGYPGHAMIVMDVAVNNSGGKLVMLAQSYMPAQDLHIVKNPVNAKLSPWYEVNNAEVILTPEWKFYKNQLRKWQ
jgi:hypothetical protein